MGQADLPAPVITESIPETPWNRASADFRSLPGRKHMLVDDMSKYPEVEIVTSTAAAEIIPKIEKILATHGMI